MNSHVMLTKLASGGEIGCALFAASLYCGLRNTTSQDSTTCWHYMEDSASDSSGSISTPTVSSVLGVKGSLRFRRHGASQKAHVVLRRVELQDDSLNDAGKGPVAYFSLFAQKRIEVKPGKEILLAVASEDGSFTDQAVIFEGDLLGSDDTTQVEEETHTTNIEHVINVPFVPPKMRRTWNKAHEQVSVAPGE